MSPFQIGLTVALAAFPAISHAAIIGVETFDYTNGAISSQAGGTFWDYSNNTATPTHTGTASAWSAPHGAPTSSSGQLVTHDSSARRAYNGASEYDGAVNDPLSGPSSDANIVYHRVSFTTGASVPDEILLNSFDFGTARVRFGKSSGSAELGLELLSPLAVASNSSTTVESNTTYLIVTKIDYDNNLVELFINPNLSQPEGTADVSETYTGTNWSSAISLSSSSGDPVSWDNLVVATTWDDLGTVVTTRSDENDGSLNPAAGGGEGVSLREAIDHSPPGSLITFAPGLDGQTIPITNGQLVISRNLALDGSSLSMGVVLDGEHQNRLFKVEATGSLRAEGLTFTRGSVAGGSGGAIGVSDGELLLLDCTLSDSIADIGGAIFSDTDLLGTSTRLIRCTLTGNRATRGGGAIINGDGLTILEFCTIAGNSAAAGGGVASYGDNFTRTESVFTIISGNTDDDVAIVGGSTAINSFQSIGFNLIGDGNAAGGFAASGDQTGITDPVLSPLSWFGGPTPTMHPLVDSPVIDAGGSVDIGGSDQRGFSRFTDGDGNGSAQLDIGAVEAGPGGYSAGGPYLRVNTLVDEDDGSAAFSEGSGTGTSLREAVKYAPEGAVITFERDVSFEQNSVVLTMGQILIARSLFIDASNFLDPIVISGNDASRVFRIDEGAEVAMHHLTLTGGRTEDGANAGIPGRTGNDAASGGGIYSAGGLSLIQCHLRNNRTGDGGNGAEGTGSGFGGFGGDGGHGGGIYSLGRLCLIACQASGNETGKAGSGARGGPDAEPEDDGHDGGGGNGGAIWCNGPLSVLSSHFTSNSCDGDGNRGGGAIYAYGPTKLSNSALLSNHSKASGGAIYVGSDSLTVEGCTITGNIAQSGGGLRFSGGTSSRIFRTTISGNTAGSAGGAIETNRNASLELEHCTLSGNEARNTFLTGGAIFSNGTVVANHSIIAGNRPDNVSGNPLTGTNNLIDVDPQLGPHSDYGGATFTMLPNPLSSPALDAATGSTATADQRGLPMNGTPDIGAVEVQASLVGFTDTDSDGMDDRLEPRFGFVVGDMDGHFDNDGDGNSNAEELASRTGPRDIASSLKILGLSKVGNQTTVTFTTFPGMNYFLHAGPDPSASAESHGFITPASGFTLSATITTNPPKYFFKVERP
ncbi:choice-of-anchor Q domain-containing protein [Haloferula chungangensis]|uniref:Choice-of-anchor Q domain-containing protein n=1 Tax=Haloferula chungangensis TaxID=1048331 RepID=A0ABW2L696_9BACT